VIILLNGCARYRALGDAKTRHDLSPYEADVFGLGQVPQSCNHCLQNRSTLDGRQFLSIAIAEFRQFVEVPITVIRPHGGWAMPSPCKCRAQGTHRSDNSENLEIPAGFVVKNDFELR